MTKVILFHPMQQHSYKTAEALITENLLFEYWTSIYYQPEKKLYKFLKLILSKSNIKRMCGRSCETISPYVKTKYTLLGLIFLFVGRIDKNGRMSEFFQYYLSKFFGKFVAKRAIKQDVDIVIAYDTWAHGLIKELNRKHSSIKVIVDYSSLYAEEIVKIIKKDIEINNIGEKPYIRSINKFLPKYLEAFKYEKDNADYFFSPSNVVDNSLIDYGVEKKKIFRCTYGSYFEKTTFINKTYDTVTFIYIGRMSYAKGVHYLIEAFNRISRTDCKLLLVGADTDNLIRKIDNRNIKYVGLVHHDEIPELLKKSDVVISASLYDSFSLSILEAVAYNLPILCTNNIGVVDYVTDKNGISFDIQNSDQIYEAIMELMDNKVRLNELSKNVGEILNYTTWDNYFRDICTSVNSIEGNM